MSQKRGDPSQKSKGKRGRSQERGEGGIKTKENNWNSLKSNETTCKNFDQCECFAFIYFYFIETRTHSVLPRYLLNDIFVISMLVVGFRSCRWLFVG